MQSNKEKILQVLLAHQGTFISGEQIGKMLFLSRNAVWKNIKNLQNDGYAINAISNKGYSLSLTKDILSAEGIQQYLKKAEFFDIEVHKSLASTNDTLKQLATQNASEGKVVVASEQTAGKGRFGRKFNSPDGTGVYFSLLLRPKLTNSEATLLTSMAAIAVCRAINKASGKKAYIKWVNDIYLNNKKICGILSEASFTLENACVESIVLGFGLNIYAPNDGFSNEISGIAGALFTQKIEDIRNKLIAYILNECEELYKNFDAKQISKEYKELSLILGKKIQIVKNGKVYTALALDIDENNHLLVEYADKTTEKLNSGEVSTLPLEEN